jgi:hypothetical protein
MRTKRHHEPVCVDEANVEDAVESAPEGPEPEPAGVSRRGLITGAALAAAGGVGVTLLSSRPAAASPNDFDVKTFGATGNGVTDDTIAIRNAITAAETAGGGTVFFPPGHYRVTGTLTVNSGIRLEGVGWEVNGTTIGTGSFIYCENTGFDILHINGNAPGTVVRDLAFRHKQPAPVASGSWTPTMYGWCILIEAVDTYVENVLVYNPSHGIYVNGNGAVGRVTLNRIFGQPFVQGIRIERGYDVVYVQNVHLWTFYSNLAPVTAYTRANGIGIFVGRADNPKFESIFTYAYKWGFQFGTTPNAGSCNKFQLVNVDCDGSENGLYITGNNVSGQITNYLATGLGTGLTSNNAIFILGAGCLIMGVNMFIAEMQHNGIRIEGASSRCMFDNVDIYGWNRSGLGFPGIEQTGTTGIVKVGFCRMFSAPTGTPLQTRNCQLDT